MSNYSDPITATGSLITFDAPAGGIFDSLSVPITPTQDLHGYANPWPAGGGKNKLSLSSVTLGGDEPRTKRIAIDPIPAGTYKFSGVNSGTANSGFGFQFYNEVSAGQMVGNSIPGSTLTLSADAKSVYVYMSSTDYSNGKTVILNELQIESGSSATSYTPYSNICPISGRTGLSVYVSPTTEQANATTYAVDWTSEAGTVYGGTDEVVGGVLTDEWAEIPSYNGETITEPWLSSMDEYSPGATPTTGAQVVYKLATPLTYQLTPTQISMLVGSNNVWVDTSAVITLIYRLLQVERQTDRTSIGKRAESLDVLGKFSSISKVEVNVTENLFYEAGDSSGRTLTIDCPFGTQEMADNLLAMLEGFYYQPYEARKAIIDPAFEIGDGVTVGNVYGGIFSIHQKCGPLHLADLSAPADEEIDHEYKFTPAAERKIERRLNNMESELSVQAGEISAKVDRQGGDPSSVSWLMDSDVFKVAVDGSDVLTVDENGLIVNGDGTFTGSVQAKNIRYGGSSGTFHGGGISGGSISTAKFTSGINTSLGNADYSADVFSGAVTANWTKTRNLQSVGTFLLNGTFNVGGIKTNFITKTVKDGNGNNMTIHYLGY